METKKFYFFVIFLILICSQHLKLATSQDTDSEATIFNFTDLATWEPPSNLYKDFSYYLSGYDLDGRPVIVFELGRWNFTKYYGKGDSAVEAQITKYLEQFWYRLSKYSNKFNNTEGIFLINDMDGFSIRQFTIPGILPVFLRQPGFMLKVFDSSKSTIIGLNLNVAGRTLFEILGPFLGEIMGTAEFFGTNKDRYVPRLIKDIPRDQLPEWYGGKQGFKPALVFGAKE